MISKKGNYKHYRNLKATDHTMKAKIKALAWFYMPAMFWVFVGGAFIVLLYLIMR